MSTSRLWFGLLTGQRNVEQQSQQQHQHRLNHELDHRDQAAKATQAAASDSSEVRTEDGRVGDVRELPFRVLLHVPFTLAPKVALSDCFCVLSRSKQPPTRKCASSFPYDLLVKLTHHIETAYLCSHVLGFDLVILNVKPLRLKKWFYSRCYIQWKWMFSSYVVASFTWPTKPLPTAKPEPFLLRVNCNRLTRVVHLGMDRCPIRLLLHPKPNLSFYLHPHLHITNFDFTSLYLGCEFFCVEWMEYFFNSDFFQEWYDQFQLLDKSSIA